VLADIGLDMPTAVRLYLAKIVQTRSIPFTLTASPAPPVEPVTPEIAVTQEQIDAVDATWEKRKKARAATTTRKPRPP
jgi:DNA-damage-inducible protein J